MFILTSSGRDKMFPQGRCYLSAETLTEMRGWMGDIRCLLGSKRSEFFSSISDADKNSISRKEKDHILTRNQEDKSIRSSFDTLQSVKRKSRVLSPEPCLNTSYPAQIPWRPHQKSASPQSWPHTGHGVLGLDEADSSLNLTYSYSSDEDEAAGRSKQRDLVTCPRSPRSVDTCLRRRVIDKNKHLAFIDSSEEDLSCLDDLVERKTAADENQSYNSLEKKMETAKQQSEKLGDLFKQNARDGLTSSPPSGLQEKMEAVTQIIQCLETEAQGVIQVRLEIWVTQSQDNINTMLHPQYFDFSVVFF